MYYYRSTGLDQSMTLCGWLWINEPIYVWTYHSSTDILHHLKLFVSLLPYFTSFPMIVKAFKTQWCFSEPLSWIIFPCSWHHECWQSLFLWTLTDRDRLYPSDLFHMREDSPSAFSLWTRWWAAPLRLVEPWIKHCNKILSRWRSSANSGNNFEKCNGSEFTERLFVFTLRNDLRTTTQTLHNTENSFSTAVQCTALKWIGRYDAMKLDHNVKSIL